MLSHSLYRFEAVAVAAFAFIEERVKLLIIISLTSSRHTENVFNSKGFCIMCYYFNNNLLNIFFLQSLFYCFKYICIIFIFYYFNNILLF